MHTFFFYVPKRRSKKRAPNCVGPVGCPALLAVVGTKKTRLRLKQVLRLFPTTAQMLGDTGWDYNLIFFILGHL